MVRLMQRARRVDEQRIDDSVELELFLRMAERGRLGAGERSAIAVALNRKCALAIDDSRAIKRAMEEAGITGISLSIVRTQDIVIELIKQSVLSVEAADAIHSEWATNHRFKLKITSFRRASGEDAPTAQGQPLPLHSAKRKPRA